MTTATRHLLPGRTEHAVDVLAAAFAVDPLTQWMLPDPDGRNGHLRAFMQLAAGRSLSVGHAYETVCGGGAALWSPPGVDFFGDAQVAELGALLVAANGDRFELVLEGLMQLAGFHPDVPHFYLSTIGVGPDSRGRGLGQQLLDRVLAVCDAEGVEAYLESSNPRNVSLYERSGFTVMAELAMPDGGPVVRPMHRPAP